MGDKSIVIDILGDISLAWWEADEMEALGMANKINMFLGKVDYRLADFETPIVLNEGAEPIDKSGPNLKNDNRYIPFFEKLDIDGYLLANNHLGDYGEVGIVDTINLLQDLKKDYIGAAKMQEEIYKPLRKEIDGIKLSIFSVCENEFGVAAKDQIGVAGYNKKMLKKLIEEENIWADYKIMIFHGGTEYYPFPSPGQKERYHELVDWGMDAVVGMHTHCPQGYEIYKEVPIVYSVGNFFFPRRFETPFEGWKLGYIARMTLGKEKKVSLDVIPYEFDVYGLEFSAFNKNRFIKYLDEISEVINDDLHLENLYNAWATMSGAAYFKLMCRSAVNVEDRGNLSHIKNMFSCESHDELLRTYLNLKYKHEIGKFAEKSSEIKWHMRMLEDSFWCGGQRGKILDETDCFIWGISQKASILFEKLKVCNRKIVFVDKDPLKQGLAFMGNEIISPDELVYHYKDQEIYICTTQKSALEIKKYLKKNGIEKNISIC